ncbi:hypothetical protein [Azohydromonas aeria]|uniref:hypothetical protein n=1 Tax=Azohydromonas aeria TaxID=2590212 RepID=UPI0012FC84E0|nr:hypothetical protein [Azohydromonas aeria]
MPLNAGNAEQRRRQRKTSKSRPKHPGGGPRRPRPHVEGAAAARPLPGPTTPARAAKAAAPAARAADIDAGLQSLADTARAFNRPFHREAALLAAATVGCWLIPADAAVLGLGVREAAFLAVLALLAAWLPVRRQRQREALNRHFDTGLARVNQAVADPAERLVYRSKLARLRAQALAPRRFLAPASSLLAALALWAAALLAARLGA